MKNKNRYTGRKGFRSSVHEFDGQSHLSVAAHVCINIHCPHLGLVASYKKKTCQTLPGRQSAGRFRWLKSSVQVGWLSWQVAGFSVYVGFSPPARLQQQQSYGSVMCSLMWSPCLEGWLGEVACDGWVPGGRVWAMGTPPGTKPSIGPGIPPGATPTTPGGNLEMDRM